MNNPSSWLPPGFDMPRPTPPVPAVLHAVGPTDRPDAANVSHPAPAAALPRQVVTSFDVFDTLIARRCMHPQQIFVEMERRSGLPGLAQQRIEAERRVQRGARASHHVLADIYRELSAAMALDEAQTEALAQLEIQVEFDNVVPIADNLARLDAHSLLLSDMYLPEAVIRALLRRAGLSRELPLLRSNDGKSSGRLWRELSAQGVQCLHLGDNRVADVERARAAGMRAELTTLHAPTHFEQELYLGGLPQTAKALRAARLATPTGDLPAALQTLQGELNLPTLLVACLVALTHARQAGLGRLCFASRDGRPMQAMADALIASGGFGALQTRYWYTSRFARSSGDPAYLDYCRELFDSPCLLLDLCGTGTSVTRLLDGLKLSSPPRLFVAEHVHAPAHVREMTGLYHMDKPPATPMHVFDTRSYVCNVTLEMLNYCCEGMVRGVRRVGESFLPVRDPVDLHGPALALAQRQQDYLGGLIAALGRELSTQAELLDELNQQLPALATLLHKRLDRFDAEREQLAGWFRASHDANEVALKLELARRA